MRNIYGEIDIYKMQKLEVFLELYKVEIDFFLLKVRRGFKIFFFIIVRYFRVVILWIYRRSVFIVFVQIMVISDVQGENIVCCVECFLQFILLYNWNL